MESHKPLNRPNQDADDVDVKHYKSDVGTRGEPRNVERGIADADEKAREKAGQKEPVRNTPPAGDWNDTIPGD